MIYKCTLAERLIKQATFESAAVSPRCAQPAGRYTGVPSSACGTLGPAAGYRPGEKPAGAADVEAPLTLRSSSWTMFCTSWPRSQCFVYCQGAEKGEVRSGQEAQQLSRATYVDWGKIRRYGN